jgi:hypothetical protein
MKFTPLITCLILLAALCPLPVQGAVDALGRINVKAYGAKGDNATDDTKAIQDAFAAVRENPYAEIVFPAGVYRISDVINIGGGANTRITGVGDCTITQMNPEKDIFYSDFAWRMTISGLTFRNGMHQVNLGNPNTDQGLVIVEKCKFIDAAGVAVQMRKNSNSTHLVVKDCNFSLCDQTLISHTDQSIFRDSWITTGWMKNKAAIENRGGRMVCENILGVPLVTGADQRWIDNYGLLTCRSFRFGGEFGGFTPVVNWAKRSPTAGGAAVVLEDCWVSALANKKRMCAVYCEEVPNTLVIRHCQLSGVPPVMVAPTLDLKRYFDHVRPGMLHFDFTGNSGEFAGQLPAAMLKAAKQRNTKPEPIEGQLTAKATKVALAKAVAAVKAMPADAATPAVYEGRTQKTDPADYVEFTNEIAVWDVEDYMDGMSVRNSAYLAVAPAGDDMVIVRRAPGMWPHVLVREVEIDLDATPFFSWKQKDSGKPSAYAIKMIHNESQKMMLLAEQHWMPFYDYRCVDLRKTFGLTGGKHTFSIRFYALGINITSATEVVRADAGDYQIIDFFRAEAE